MFLVASFGPWSFFGSAYDFLEREDYWFGDYRVIVAWLIKKS